MKKITGKAPALDFVPCLPWLLQDPTLHSARSLPPRTRPARSTTRPALCPARSARPRHLPPHLCPLPCPALPRAPLARHASTSLPHVRLSPTQSDTSAFPFAVVNSHPRFKRHCISSLRFSLSAAPKRCRFLCLTTICGRRSRHPSRPLLAPSRKHGRTFASV